MSDDRIALHFGYRRGDGHFLQSAEGRTLWGARDRPAGFPRAWTDGLLDGGLLKNGRHPDKPDGRVFWTCGGHPLWLAFVWWDRSGDSRSASNSGFYVRGFDVATLEQAFAFAQAQFPHVVARQMFPLVLQDTQHANPKSEAPG